MEQGVTARRHQFGVFNWLVPPEALRGDRVQQEPQTGRSGPRLCVGYSVAGLSGSQSHTSPWDREFFRHTSLHSPHKVPNTLPISSSPIQAIPSLSTYCVPTMASAAAWRNPDTGESNMEEAVLVLAVRVRGTGRTVGQEGQESRSLGVEPRCRVQTGSRGSVVYPGELGVWALQSDLHLNPTS